MSKFHYSEKAQQIKLCQASMKECPLGGFHGSREEVKKHIEDINSLKFQNLKSLTKTVKIESHPKPVYENEDEQEFWDEYRKSIGTFVWNNNEFILQPEDTNASTIYCTSCSTILSKDSEYFKNSKTATCEKCGHSLRGPFNTGAALARDSLKYFDNETLRSTTWFHSTQNPDWEKSLENEDRDFIHLGTAKSAEDRCKTLHNYADRPTYVYELEISRDAPVHNKTHYEDPYQDDKVSLKGDSQEYSKIDFNGVTRYVNEMEDPGSISLLVNPKVIKIKTVRQR